MKFLNHLIFSLTFSVCIVGQANANDPQIVSQAGSACTTNSSSYVIRRGEPGFEQIASDLNTFVESPNAAFDKVKLPSGRLFIPSNAEFIRIDAEVSACNSNIAGQPMIGDFSIGGCDYVGCTGSLPSEFDTMPVGSVVSMSSCGGGISTSGTFQKASNGTWVMKSYSQEYVTECSPMSG